MPQSRYFHCVNSLSLQMKTINCETPPELYPIACYILFPWKLHNWLQYQRTYYFSVPRLNSDRECLTYLSMLHFNRICSLDRQLTLHHGWARKMTQFVTRALSFCRAFNAWLTVRGLLRKTLFIGEARAEIPFGSAYAIFRDRVAYSGQWETSCEPFQIVSQFTLISDGTKVKITQLFRCEEDWFSMRVILLLHGKTVMMYLWGSTSK